VKHFVPSADRYGLYVIILCVKWVCNILN
jgi:hypothetical protein